MTFRRSREVCRVARAVCSQTPSAIPSLAPFLQQGRPAGGLTVSGLLMLDYALINTGLEMPGNHTVPLEAGPGHLFPELGHRGELGPGASPAVAGRGTCKPSLEAEAGQRARTLSAVLPKPSCHRTAQSRLLRESCHRKSHPAWSVPSCLFL